MSEAGKDEAGDAGPNQYLLEWLALAGSMAAAYQAFGATAGGLVAGGIGLVYILYILRPRFKRPRVARSERQMRIYASLYQGSGGFAALALFIAVIIAWMSLAYLSDTDVLFGLLDHAQAALVSSALLMATCYVAGLLLLRRRGAISGRLCGLLRADMARLSRSPLVMSFALTLGLMGLTMTNVAIVSIAAVAGSLLPDREPTFLEIAALFPFAVAGVPATAALLVAARASRITDAALVSRVRRHLEGGADPPRWPGLVTAAAAILALIAAVHPLHFGTVASLSTVAGIGPSRATRAAVEAWIEARRNEGLGSSEIADRLNRNGRWSPRDPEAGLAALLPDLGTDLAGRGLACEITLAAEAADRAALAGSAWIPEEIARSDLKYCLRVACPSPVAWPAPPALVLSSSHPSRKRYWRDTLYLDIFAKGIAAEPGGYCTAEGDLSDAFLG